MPPIKLLQPLELLIFLKLQLPLKLIPPIKLVRSIELWSPLKLFHPLKLMPLIKLCQPLELMGPLKPLPPFQLTPPLKPGPSCRPNLDGRVLYRARDPERFGARMHMHVSEVKRFQSVQPEPNEEVENGKVPIKRARSDELRQLVRSHLVHRVDQAANHLHPVDHLRPRERAPVLAELDRPVRRRDEREEIVREAPVRIVLGARVQPHQLPHGSPALDHRDRVPGVLAFEHGGRSFGVLVADSMGGVEAVELVLECGGQHAEMLERLQRETALPVADVDMEATGCVHKDVELSI